MNVVNAMWFVLSQELTQIRIFLIIIYILSLTDAANSEHSPGEKKIQKEIETIDYIDKWVYAKQKVNIQQKAQIEPVIIETNTEPK